MFVTAGIVRAQLGKTQQIMAQRKEKSPTDNIEQLLAQQRIISSKVAFVSEKKARMSEIFDDNNALHWDEILNNIRRNTLKTLYITRLNCSDGATIILEGNALSYKSIHIFAELLGKGQSIESAVVTETNRNYNVEGLVAYSITCVLADRGGPIDAD